MVRFVQRASTKQCQGASTKPMPLLSRPDGEAPQLRMETRVCHGHLVTSKTSPWNGSSLSKKSSGTGHERTLVCTESTLGLSECFRGLGVQWSGWIPPSPWYLDCTGGPLLGTN